MDRDENNVQLDSTQSAGDLVLPFTRAQLDVSSEERVSEVVAQAKPDVVLNTAAFRKVEECEKKPALAPWPSKSMAQLP